MGQRRAPADARPWEKTLFSGYIMNMWNREDGGATGKR